jgi:hypothetical protein
MASRDAHANWAAYMRPFTLRRAGSKMASRDAHANWAACMRPFTLRRAGSKMASRDAQPNELLACVHSNYAVREVKWPLDMHSPMGCLHASIPTTPCGKKMASGHARACGGTAAGIPTSLLRRHRRLRLHRIPIPLPFAVLVSFFQFFFLLAAACKLLTYILPFCWVWISRVRLGARRIFNRLGRCCCSRSCALRPPRSYLQLFAESWQIVVFPQVQIRILICDRLGRKRRLLMRSEFWSRW